MAAITYQALYDGVIALSIDGVRVLNSPPGSVKNSDCPVMYPVMPSGERGDFAASCIESAKTRSIGLVMILGPVAISTLEDNYTALPGHMDKLETALDGWSLTNFIDYQINASGNILIGEHAYWGLEVNITVTDFK